MENWINNKKYTQNGKRILKLLSNFSNYTIIYFRLLFFLAIIFYSSNCSETGDTNYIQSIEYFEDKVGSKDFEEVISSPLQKYSSKHFIRFGFSPSTYWIRVVLKKDVKDSPLFLEIGNPRLSEVDFYYYNDRTEKWETKGYGRFTNLDEREFKTHHYISAFSPSSKFQEIWIRVFSRTEVYLPIDISSVNQIVNYNRGQDIVKSWVIGFNFLVCILGLIGFIIFKRDYLLYFFAYLFFLNLSLVENESIAGDYFSLSRLIRYDQIDQVTRYLTYIFAGLFSFNYILTKELKEKYNYLQFIFFINLGFILVTFFLPYSDSELILNIVILLEMLSLIITGIIPIPKSFPIRLTFYLAWSVAFFGYVYDRVWDLNIIPASFEGGIPYSYLSNFHHFLLLLSIVYTINQENVFQKEKDVKILNLEKSNLEHKEKILYMESKAINENLKVSELKNEFIRIIALSFKEPLQNIVGISESLLDHSEGDLNYDQSQSVHGVLQSSRLLINAINDLSDYSLLESGKLELKNLVFDINIMVEIVISAISPLIGSKDMVFVNKVQESLPLIEADENRLQLILYNLFYSSIQSAREGEIIVSAKPIPGFIKIYITYLGEPFELPTEKFDSTIDISAHNSNPVYNRLFNLMVTVRLVKAQGGRIKIYQEQNKTVIKFTIPVAKDQRKNVVSRKVFKKNWSEYELNSHFKELSGDGEGDQGNILIVDDESLNLETYRNYLEGVGFKVTVTNSGREALVLLNKKSFDLILVDMVMPYMSGPKLCELIREKHDKINLPILLLTNKYSTVDLIETLDYANDYIMKPLTREKLIARIKNLLNLSRMNMAYKRFVPLQMIKLLGKSGITEIKLGDQIEKEMTVLFSDLRSYTMLSEKMTPEENFEFLNTYFRRVGPMIRKHNGYIDKYMGDAIMAVFPNNSDDAVRSAIDIQKAISKFNKTRIKNGLEIIQAGIGIHTGDVILGTIGEDERMEGTVISDAVNLSSRLENLTKLYNASILITMDTFIALENQDDYTFRILDRVKVKGKEKFVTVIEILDGYDDSILEAMLDSKIYFEEGVTFYLNRDFDKALGLFSKVLEFVPDDKATKIYIQRAEYYKEHNVPVDWDGVEILEEKFY